MLVQLRSAKPDARVQLVHAGVELGLHRGRIIVHAPQPAPYEFAWQGEGEIALPHGTLAFVATNGDGVSTAQLAMAATVVKPRGGGERLRLDAGGRQRALKSLLQDSGVPHWERAALPLVWCGGALAVVPGIGVDAAFRASVGERGWRVEWAPNDRRVQLR
jgi:tRNA(Ile)-lysidine synthase